MRSQSLFTPVLLLCVTCYYQLSILQKHMSWNAFLESNFDMPRIWESKSPLRLYWIFEMAVCSLHTPPGQYLKWDYHFLDRVGSSDNRITDTQLCYLVMSIRAYFIIRIIGLYISRKLRGATIDILRRFAGIDFNLSFSVRYMLIKHTYKILLGFLGCVVLWCSYGLRMCERSFPESNVLFISDAIWLTLITAATIGFGDFYPSTHCGRSAALIAAFAGEPIIAHTTKTTVNPGYVLGRSSLHRPCACQ
jgi:hypothetical protein